MSSSYEVCNEQNNNLEPILFRIFKNICMYLILMVWKDNPIKEINVDMYVCQFVYSEIFILKYVALP